MPTLADPCTIRYNPVSYYLLPASPRVLSSLSCTPVPPWPTQKYQAWFLEPLVENLKSDIGWTRLGVPYLKWTLKISLQMCHRVRMFRQNVKSSEKEWKQGIFITRLQSWIFGNILQALSCFSAASRNVSNINIIVSTLLCTNSRGHWLATSDNYKKTCLFEPNCDIDGLLLIQQSWFWSRYI